MKTVFEGIVNGVKFDNVADYNKALTEAIQAGKVVQASSRTYSKQNDVNEPATCHNECKVQANQNIPNYFIGLNKDNYYMDMITGNEEEDAHVLEQSREVLDQTYEEVVSSFDKLSLEQLNDYKNNLSEVLTHLDDDKNKARTTIENKTKTRDELLNKVEAYKKMVETFENNVIQTENDLDVLYNCAELNNIMCEYYSDLISAVVEEISHRTSPKQNLSESHFNEPAKIGAVPCDTTITETDKQREMFVEGVKNLLNEIFNG